MTFLYWLTSKTVRHATDTCRHVRKIINAQRDIVAPQGIAAIEASLNQIEATIAARGSKEQILGKISELEPIANKWLKPYPNSAMRENLEVVLVAIAVALAVRTFFLQPFQIPTGSMQPTLFGITHEDLRGEDDSKIPPVWGQFFDFWARGFSYHHVVAKVDGELRDVPKSKVIFPFVRRQSFLIGDQWHSTWWVGGDYDFGYKAGITDRNGNPMLGRTYKRGEDVFKLKVVAGDHLFVDRVTYNFCRPNRGDIIVFETKGIPENRRAPFGIPADQFYIKRLVGLGGEKLQIGNDRHLIINGNRLDAGTPRFENIYSFPPKSSPRESQYSGHMPVGYLSGPSDEYQVPEKSYLAMGDNTMNSSDGRYWGHFPQDSVIGKSFFVYWPILSKNDKIPGRFGWGVR